MKLDKYNQAVQKHQKKEPWLKDSFLAFLGGGILGLIGQCLIDLFVNLCHLSLVQSSALMSMCIVFLTSIITLFGFYKKIGRIFGAGLFIPTTGFANSITSSAMEGRYEGFIIGVGGQMFSLAGSVITYGIVSSIILLIIKQILMFFGVGI